MDFSPALFNNLLNKMQSFMWRAASACPCVNPASGASQDACPICNGKGRIWASEVQGNSGMQNMTTQKGFAMFGTWEPGDALFTVGSDSALYAIRQYDRVRALYSTTSFSLVVVPGANDKLLGTIKSVSSVFWLNTAGDGIINGDLPTVNADGSLTWVSGQNAPPAGTQYTVSGVKYDEFYAFNALPANRNDSQGALLPKKLQMRRFDLFNR